MTDSFTQHRHALSNAFYQTAYGHYFVGDAMTLCRGSLGQQYADRVNLILTSPPFPLNKKKQYGNRLGQAYLDWFSQLAPLFSELLAPDGSLIIELGNAWEAGRPVQSLLPWECLSSLVNNPHSDLRLIQEFICYNPSRLPSPAQWVTVNRWRAVDSYTHLWWLAKSDLPKADNTKVLRPYSTNMKRMIAKRSLNAGTRPSEHHISQQGFLQDNGGSIPHNLFELEALDEKRSVRLPHNVLSYANSASNDSYLQQCRAQQQPPHPARMPKGLINFFIEFLTDPGDLVLDPFAGSNTTGFCAERFKRQWLAIDTQADYASNSMLRFTDASVLAQQRPLTHSTAIKSLNE